MELMRIDVTFKKKEKQLYEKALQHSSPAAYIKDLIKADLEGIKKEAPKERVTNILELD